MNAKTTTATICSGTRDSLLPWLIALTVAAGSPLFGAETLRRSAQGDEASVGPSVTSTVTAASVVEAEPEPVAIDTGMVNPKGNEKASTTESSTPVDELLIETETRALGNDTALGYLGLTVDQVSSDLRKHLRTRLEKAAGVVVEEVCPRSPAARAGVRPGDVVVRFDREVLFHPIQLENLVQFREPGEEVVLTVLQMAEEVRIPIRIGYPPEPSTPKKETVEEPRPAFNKGLHVFTFSADSGLATLSDVDGRFQLELHFRDGRRSRVIRWAGTRRELGKRLRQATNLPDELKDAVQDQLNNSPNAESSGGDATYWRWHVETWPHSVFFEF